MDSLVKKQSRRDVKAAFNNLPTSLDNTYDDAMTRISAQDKDDIELAMKVLSWISYAIRSLNITELQHAIAAEDLGENVDPEALIDHDLLVSVCGGLITIDQKTSTVRLIHYTAQEYFNHHRDRIFPSAKTTIARTCVEYLSLKAFSDETISRLLLSRTKKQAREVILEGHPLLDYTVYHWGRHSRGTPEHILAPKIDHLLNSNSLIVSLFYIGTDIVHLSTYASDNKITKAGQTDIDAILCLAICRMRTTMERWLQVRENRNFPSTQSTKLATYAIELVAFGAATMWGHEDLAKIILRKQPHLAKVSDRSGETAFHKLAYLNNMVAVRLLWEHGAVINAQRRDGSTALSTAIESAANDMAEWLLNNGANDRIEKSENTALCAYVSTKNFEKAKLFLEMGLRSKTATEYEKARYLLPALLIAAEDSDISILKMLFDVIEATDYLADSALFDIFDDVDDEGITTPLHIAAQSGHKSSTSFLVEKGLPIEGLSETGWTPLHWAAERGNLEVLLYLLEEGAAVDLQTSAGQTALHKAAAKRDHLEIVAALLSFGTSVDAQMHNGNTAVNIALKRGNTDVVYVLLECGCGVDWGDNYRDLWYPQWTIRRLELQIEALLSGTQLS